MLEKAIKEIDNPNLSSNIVDVSNFKEVESNVNDITKNSNIDILINKCRYYFISFTVREVRIVKRVFYNRVIPYLHQQTSLRLPHCACAVASQR